MKCLRFLLYAGLLISIIISSAVFLTSCGSDSSSGTSGSPSINADLGIHASSVTCEDGPALEQASIGYFDASERDGGDPYYAAQGALALGLAKLAYSRCDTTVNTDPFIEVDPG